jgi:hypothetical protein
VTLWRREACRCLHPQNSGNTKFWEHKILGTRDAHDPRHYKPREFINIVIPVVRFSDSGDPEIFFNSGSPLPFVDPLRG